MNKNFLICTLFSSLTLVAVSCGSGKEEKNQYGQQDQSEEPVEALAAIDFEEHEVEAYPDAIIEMYNPIGNDNFKEGKVPFEFNIKNYPFTDGLKGFQYRIAINGSSPVSYHSPVFQREFKTGTYRVLAYLIDEEGLALKEFGNYVDRDFTVGDSQSFPDSDEPYMALNLPVEGQVYDVDEDVIIDFLLIGGSLKEEKLQFVVELNGKRHQVTELTPLNIINLAPGNHELEVKLIRTNGRELEGIFTSARRTISIEP